METKKRKRSQESIDFKKPTVNTNNLKAFLNKSEEVVFFVTRGSVVLSKDDVKVGHAYPFHIVVSQNNNEKKNAWGIIPQQKDSIVLPFLETVHFSWYWQRKDEPDTNWKPLLSLKEEENLRLTRLLGNGLKMPYEPFDCMDFFAWMNRTPCPTQKYTLPLCYVASCPSSSFVIYFDGSEYSIDPGNWIFLFDYEVVHKINDLRIQGPLVKAFYHAAWCVGPKLFFSKFGSGTFKFCSMETLFATYPKATCFQVVRGSAFNSISVFSKTLIGL